MTANPNIRLASKTIGPESSCGAPGSAAADLTRAAIEQLICLGEVDGPFRGLEGRQEAAGADCEMGSLDLQVRRTMAQARIAAPADAALLIKGEKGTGKRTLGRMIHSWSKRSAGPFVIATCSTLGPELSGYESFGYDPGSHDDPLADGECKIVAAEGGTLFLDEVAALPMRLQLKLLKLIQEQKYQRTGDALVDQADVRIVAATSRDLEAAVAAGAFHQDLSYRLSVIELALPPLRHRSDQCALAEHFLALFARQTGNRFTGFVPEARAALVQHHWPGNLCELRNAIERAVILGAGPEVLLTDLPEQIVQALARSEEPIEVGRRVSLEALVDEHVKRVLRNSSSLEEAARVLKINPSTLYRKRKRLGL